MTYTTDCCGTGQIKNPNKKSLQQKIVFTRLFTFFRFSMQKNTRETANAKHEGLVWTSVQFSRDSFLAFNDRREDLLVKFQ